MRDKFEGQLGLLNRLYKESYGIYRGIAARMGLTDTAFWILYAVSHADGDCTQNDLCNDWSYPVQTVNSAIKSLKGSNLVYLETIPGTRNKKRILLTKRGKIFAERFLSRVDDIEIRAFSGFTEDEREIYLSLYSRHIEALRIEEERAINRINEELGSIKDIDSLLSDEINSSTEIAETEEIAERSEKDNE